MGTFGDPAIERLVGRLVAGGVRGYLVGGWVRDAILGRDNDDVDIAVDGDAVRTAREAADAVGGAFYVLDRQRGAARVIIRDGDGPREVDFTRLKDGDLERDLCSRDFTINAMAFPLEHPSADALIDPLGGRGDLAERRLRAVAEHALRDDPIRALRAVRLAHQLDLYVDRGTRALLVDAVPLLARCSHERIRDELFRALSLSPVHDPLIDLHETGALWAVLGTIGAPLPATEEREGRFARAAETVASLEALLVLQREGPLATLGDALGRTCAQVVAPYRARIAAAMAQPLSGTRPRGALLALIAVIRHATGDSAVAPALRELRLSAAEMQAAAGVGAVRDRPEAWAAGGGAPPTVELHRYFRAAGAGGVDALLLYLAESLAAARRGQGIPLIEARCRAVASGLGAYFERHEAVVSPPALVTGDLLRTRFGLPAGPLVGELLERVREAQVEGRARTEEDALALLEAWRRESEW